MDVENKDSKILSDDEINWEARKLGAMYGFSALFIASVFGSKALGLSPRINAFSSTGKRQTNRKMLGNILSAKLTHSAICSYWSSDRIYVARIRTASVPKETSPIAGWR